MLRTLAIAAAAALSLGAGSAFGATPAICQFENTAHPHRSESRAVTVGGPSGELHIGEMVLLPTGRFIAGQPVLRDTNSGNLWLPMGSDGFLAVAQVTGPWVITCFNANSF